MALSLTRKVGQKIMIGDDIVIEVGEIRGKQVRLLLTAPRATEIRREELYPKANTFEAPDGD